MSRVSTLGGETENKINKENSKVKPDTMRGMVREGPPMELRSSRHLEGHSPRRNAEGKRPGD